MLAFDTSIISLAINGSGRNLIDPETKKPVERPGERVRYLLSSLAKNKVRILLPAPVVSELLVFSENVMEALFRYLGGEVVLEVAVFDYKAAIETARAMREKKERDGSIGADSSDIRNKIKVDYQIVAIARTQGAEAIYSQDRGLNNHSKHCGLEVRTITDIDLPPPEFS